MSSRGPRARAIAIAAIKLGTLRLSCSLILRDSALGTTSLISESSGIRAKSSSLETDGKGLPRNEVKPC